MKFAILGEADGPSASTPAARVRQFIRDYERKYPPVPGQNPAYVSIEGHGLRIDDLKKLVGFTK